MPEQIAVIGSGAIACGLAAVATKTGDETLLARSEESADRARASIEKLVGKMGDEAGPGSVSVTTDAADTAGATVFVDAIGSTSTGFFLGSYEPDIRTAMSPKSL
jgi:3-hydroxybutyryl-CoA dehydrogenase